ncbi:MAG: UDP-N-acetylglucosamine 2-epimerase (hydrolyzing) [Elusimicrobia bacterium]|nr:UDP-N-acetylglucosamine 2-epimerase (hydrolyzing) [Elusimicrobiota bacterium]
MAPIRRIAVLTTSRADYGLLFCLLKEFKRRRGLRLQLVACGAHLSDDFGRTEREIARDGFRLAARVETLPRKDTPFGVACAIGDGAKGFARAFQRLRPDLLVVLGDRFELLAACSAAAAMRIPIAHIHGGESTEGVMDEQTRHAVTKLSHLHFTAAAPYRRRVIAMGEHPSRVFNVGAPGLEYLRRLRPAGLAELERLAGPVARGRFAVVTYHPTSASPERDARTVEILLRELKRRGLRVAATFANADAGGRAINARLRRLARRDPSWVAAVPSLGQRGYLSLFRRAALVAGNSSSGIIEVPSLGVPTVNVGDRQQGRLRSPSVVDCGTSAKAMQKALDLALSPRFWRTRRKGVNVYGRGRSAARIASILGAFPRERLLRKSFYDNPR